MIKVFGCSHSRIFKKIKLDKYQIECENISGATLLGLPKRISTLNVKKKIITYLKKNKPDFLILKFGQVDIDLSYYYKLVIKGININKNKYIYNLISCYKKFIFELLNYIDKEKIIIFGINPPSLIDKKSCYIYTSKIIFNKNKTSYNLLKSKIESIEKRTAFSKLFNIKLNEMCIKNNIKYTVVFDEFLNSKNIVSDFFTNNNDHHLRGIENDETNFEPTNKLFIEKLKSIIT
jgi:hypothetical protein